MASECTLPPLPSAAFSTGASAVVEIVANAATAVAAGDELGTMQLCRVVGNTPVGLSFESPSGDYFAEAGGDRSYWNGAEIVHRTTSFKVVGWNACNTYGTTTPARDRTLLFGPMAHFISGAPWGYFWRATITRHFEHNHLYAVREDDSEIRGDYYWTTITIEDELTKYIVTRSNAAWAYTYGHSGADEDVDVRAVLKPENPDWLRYYNPTGLGSVAQSSAYLNAVIPGMTTVATGLRASVFIERVQSDYVEYVPSPSEEPPFEATAVYTVTVDAVSGARSFTGLPYVIAGYGNLVRVWPYVDGPFLNGPIVGAAPEYLLTAVSNSNDRQVQEYSAWDTKGTRMTVRVMLEWIGSTLTDSFRSAAAGFGVNATGCQVEGTCPSCAEPCLGSVFVATTQPRQVNRWLDWGWWIKQRGHCPPEP